MQIKIFCVPILGNALVEQEMNAFLRSKKILQVEQQVVGTGSAAVWSFCVRYIEDHQVESKSREKADYRVLLEPEAFQRFTAMRQIRKDLAQAEGFPAYTIFNDEELAALAALEVVDAANMQKIPGIGAKKVQKYGHYFFTPASNEASPSAPTQD